MKYLNRALVIRIMIALAIGLFLASGTDIAYPCEPPGDPLTSGCIAYEEAISHPGDLFSNEQDSMRRFVVTFAQGSFVSFAILSAFNYVRKKDQGSRAK